MGSHKKLISALVAFAILTIHMTLVESQVNELDFYCPTDRITNAANINHQLPPTVYHRTDRIVLSFGITCINDADHKLTYTWKLFRSDLNEELPEPSSEKDWKIDHLVNVDLKYIIFRPHQLIQGNYLVQVLYTVKDTDKNTYSLSGYFVVLPNKPKVIIQDGAERTANVNRPVILDASLSVDANHPERTSELTFLWTCPEIPILPDNNRAKLVLRPHTLLPNRHYTFSLAVYSPSSKLTEVATQIIHTSFIEVKIKCLANCDKSLHPHDTIEVQCTSPEVDSEPKFTFSWTPQKNVPINQIDNTRAFITLPDLQGIREPNGYAICSTEWNNVLQTAKLVFTTSLPPEEATCFLGSPIVTYLKETVSIVCVNVSSKDSFHHYNFYAKIDGHGAEALDNKLLLFHGNSPLVDVYLPLGSEKGQLEIVIEIGNGAGGINAEFNVKVEVIIPPANEYVDLLDKLVFDPNSELRSLMDNGAQQEALQLLMAIVDGLASRNKEMEPALELLKSENMLNPLIEILTFELLKVSLNSQKATQQVIGALNLLAKLKTDNENPFTSENVYEDVNYLLVSASSILRVAKKNKDFVLNGNEEESTPEDLDHFGTAVADTASKILKLANDRGNYILHEDGPVQFFNERRAIDYDVQDDINRDYFGEFHENDDEEEDDLEDIVISDVDNTATIEIALLATASREASMAIEHIMDIVAEKRLPSQEAFQFQDSHMAIHVEVEKASKLSGKVFTLQTQGSNKQTVLQLSADIQPIHETDTNLKTQNVEIQLQQIDENPFFDDLSALPSTSVVSAVVKDADTRLPLQFNNFQKHSTPFQIHLPKNPLNTNITSRHKTLHHVTVKSLKDLQTQDLVIIPFILEYNMQFEITIADYQPDISYVVAFVKDENPTTLHFCEGEMVQEIPTQNMYTAVFETEFWDYGIGDPPGEKLLEYHVAIWAKDNSDSQDLAGTNTTFSVYFTRTGCMFRDENRKFWSEKGCSAKNNPEDDKIVCTCTHLSSFAGSIFILPHDLQTLNLVDIDLESLKGNYIVLITVCTCFLLYIIFMVWCYFLDRRESSKHLPITIMADLSNDLAHSFYLVTILTGTRFDAGTSANVSLQIYGSHGRSKIYTLKETSSSRVFVRGDIATYLISTLKDLGNLEKIRLWHDNYGGSPSWYCNKILILNIKTNVESQFFVEHWLSVCHKNPMLLIQRDKAMKQDERNFCRRFKEKLANEFNNAHLWFSVIIRTPTSNFNRCQRLSCAYAALCMYMLLSIMFGGLPTDDYRSKYDVGITEININNLIVWIENLFIDCVVGFLIGYLFRSVRERHIPTLIIWRNKTKPGKSSKADNLFVPKVAPVEPIRSKKPKIGEDDFGNELGGLGNSLSDSGSSTFSIPSTDIQEVEGWLINQTDDKEIRHSYDLREPDTFIHLVNESNDKDNSDRLQRLGRHALVHSVRNKDPNSFVFEGENDIPGIEKLIDEQLRLQSKEKDGKNNKPVAEPWQNLKMSDLKIIEEELHMQSGPILTAEETKEPNKGLVIELCDLTPIEKRCGCCGYLPWWCIYLAWVVFVIVVGVCSYFTILYGFRLGYLRSLDWFLSVVVSFLKSVFIFQPVLIALRAAVKTLCSEKLEKVNQDRFQFIVREGDEEIHGKRPRKITIFQPERIHLPLNGHELFILKMEARRRIDLRRKFIYIILYSLLLCPLIYIAHSGHTKYNYRITENLRNMFRLDEINRDLVKYPYEAFLNIKDEYSLYGYLKLTFLPSLHPRRKYNGDLVTTPRFDAAYLMDDTTILIGVARIRQLRMMHQSCEISSKFHQLSSSNCIRDYDISKHDTTTYNTLWTPVEEGKSRAMYSKSNDIWKFRSSEETKALPISGHMAYYDGGGYVAELGRTLRESRSVLKYLRRVNWFDKHTRCIFIEFSTYTPSVNIFSSVILMIERGSSQGIHVSSNIYPMIVAHGQVELAGNLQEADDPTQFVTWEEVNVVLTVMMLAVLVVMLCWVLWNDYEGKIFQRFWFWLDGIIILSIFISLVIAYRKRQVMTEIEDKIETLLINEFISLQHGALWDQIQGAAFSLTQIFCFIRMWNILMHSSDKFLMLTLTLKLTSSVLFAFTILFSILLLAFALAGYLIFGSYLYEFRTIHQTFITLAHQIFESNFFYDLEKTNRVLGPLYFLFFGFFVVIISLNLFVALLNEGFYEAKQITIERRHWITYWTYAADFAKSMLRKHRKAKPRVVTEGNSVDILPSRLLEMKKVTIQFLQRRLHCDEEAVMKNMKNYADKLLQGTGMCMVSKDAQLNLEKEHKEKRMEEMRVCTLEFLKKRKQVNMSSEELKEYEEYDDHVASIRLRKLEKKIEVVTEQVNRLVHMKL